jgi:hypothetical protein
MKVLNLELIDGYEIIIGVSKPTVDPAATTVRVDSILSENPALAKTKTEEELYSENAVFARCGPGQRLVEDAEGEEFQTTLAGLGYHEKLESSGEKIADWRGVEFWMKDQKWEKLRIERLGETIPEGGVLEKDLNASQRAEIAVDKEIERISNLTPEQKNKEKTDYLNAAKREATLLKSDADIAGEQFDASAWFQVRKAEIETKYGS